MISARAGPAPSSVTTRDANTAAGYLMSFLLFFENRIRKSTLCAERPIRRLNARFMKGNDLSHIKQLVVQEEGSEPRLRSPQGSRTDARRSRSFVRRCDICSSPRERAPCRAPGAPQ